MEYFFLIILSFISSWMAFLGLIGALTKHMKYPASRSRAIKEYKGRSAQIWGAIFFVFFGIWSGIFFISEIHLKENIFIVFSTYFLTNLSGFLVALYSRKHGLLSSHK